MIAARLAALCGAAFAYPLDVPVRADAPPGSVAPTHLIDSNRSHASFEVHLRLPMRALGHFEAVSGEVRGSPAQGWRVHVDIDGSNLSFDGPAWMARITRSEAFLALDRYPNIEFLSESVSDALLHTGGELRGQLTLRGRQRPVTFSLLPSTCMRPGRDCDLQVQGSISRHAFGMNAYRLTVRDPVDVDIRVRLLPGLAP